MTLFWIICAALLLLALPFLVVPLWRGAGGGNGIRRDAANLEILRDQSAELEADLRNGLLTQEAYEQGKRELQARLLEEVKISGQPDGKPRNPARTLAIVLAVALPLFSVPLYLMIGNTLALSPQESLATMIGESGTVKSEAKLHDLEKMLERQPENPEGWFVLARSYSERKRFSDAARAFGQLVKLVPGEAQLWARYADVYAMSQNQSLKGEPTKFIEKALQLDGNDTLALALAGSAAMERGDYAGAVAHWTKLVQLLPPNSRDLPMFREGIQRANTLMGEKKGGK